MPGSSSNSLISGCAPLIAAIGGLLVGVAAIVSAIQALPSETEDKTTTPVVVESVDKSEAGDGASNGVDTEEKAEDIPKIDEEQADAELNLSESVEEDDEPVRTQPTPTVQPRSVTPSPKDVEPQQEPSAPPIPNAPAIPAPNNQRTRSVPPPRIQTRPITFPIGC